LCFCLQVKRRVQKVSTHAVALKLGANPNAIFYQTSVLHIAARFDFVPFLTAALAYGGDPNLRAGDLKESPIFDATFLPSESSVIDVLLQNGADINLTNDGEISGMKISGNTAVMKATTGDRFDVTYKLLSLGADFSVKNNYGEDVIKILEKKKGKLNSEYPLYHWISKIEAFMAHHKKG
jgi:ankyrin repeat protein